MLEDSPIREAMVASDPERGMCWLSKPKSDVRGDATRVHMEVEQVKDK